MRLANIINGVVAQIIIGGTVEWAQQRFGGNWVKVGNAKCAIGYSYMEGEGFRPPSPYPSWTYNGSEWIPPIPIPNDGKMHQWSEDEQTWNIYSE